MRADHVTLSKVFTGERHHAVPVFQRPYVWSLANWADLWRDVRTSAEGVETETAVGAGALYDRSLRW